MAFFAAFRYYAFLKRRSSHLVSSSNRLSIILGAALGAFVGSSVMGLLENPVAITSITWTDLYNVKTIIGGLFGGLLGVGIFKRIINETNSSGDLFTLPMILGMSQESVLSKEHNNELRSSN
ncbi:MAG: hypothetical protein WKF87_16150 [Chryseolinea sp.]